MTGNTGESPFLASATHGRNSSSLAWRRQRTGATARGESLPVIDPAISFTTPSMKRDSPTNPSRANVTMGSNCGIATSRQHCAAPRRGISHCLRNCETANLTSRRSCDSSRGCAPFWLWDASLLTFTYAWPGAAGSAHAGFRCHGELPLRMAQHGGMPVAEKSGRNFRLGPFSDLRMARAMSYLGTCRDCSLPTTPASRTPRPAS